jgi:peptidoglycan/LPS O-acetylase OafA/YrhL
MHLIALLLITPLALSSIGFHQLTRPASHSELTLAWFANALMIHGLAPVETMHLVWNTPSWSISAEACFYLIFPFFVRAVLGRARSTDSLWRLIGALYVVEAAAFLSASLIRQWLLAQGAAPDLSVPVVWFSSPVIRVWEFLQGCVLGAIFLRRRAQAPSARPVPLASLRGRNWLLVAFLGAVPMVAVLAGLPALQRVLQPWGLHLLYSPLFLLLLLTLATGPTFLTPLLEHRWALLLGEASYSLYILHWLPFSLLARQVQVGAEPAVWLSAAIMVATVPAAIVCYWCIERPARRVLRRCWPRAEARRALAPPGD